MPVGGSHPDTRLIDEPTPGEKSKYLLIVCIDLVKLLLPTVFPTPFVFVLLAVLSSLRDANVEGCVGLEDGSQE